MFTTKRFALLVAAASLLTLFLAACQPQVVEVEVTRVVTETITEVVEGEEVVVEVTRVVTEVVEAEPEPAGPTSKDLIVCTAQEPETLYG